MANSEPVKIYHIEGRRSFRVAWLCEELHIPYTLHFREGDIAGSMADIKAVFPIMPLAPTVFYRGQWVVETGAIIDILTALEGDGRLVPPRNSPDFIIHCQWMHFSEGMAAARMLSERFVSLSMGVNPDQLPEGYRAGVAPPDPAEGGGILSFIVGSRGIFDFMEDHLKRHPYFGGSEFTAADIMMHFPVQTARLIAWIDTSQYPEVMKWQQRVEARPAFASAQQKCNPSGADEFGQPLNQPRAFPVRPLSA